jgi:arabinogalactan oligomer / maltooligosaccharide transport system substrate-binding protein
MGGALTLALGLGGCSSGVLFDTLFIYVENESSQSRQAEIGDSRGVVQQLLTDFEEANPGVRIQVRHFSSEAIVPATAYRSSRALGPDLLVTRVVTALRLNQQHLTTPVRFRGKGLEEVHPRFLAEFRLADNRFLAVPLLAEPQLACFNRRRVPDPPTSLDQLIALSAKGMRVGLPLAATDLYWTASGGDAEDSLQALLESADDSAAASFTATDQRKLLGWLNWLDNANRQQNVEFADESIDLAERLGRGERDWISCNSLWLGRLGRQMKGSLAVSELPGPDGQPATTITRLKVWSFGTHSSPRQRQLAQAFVLFTLNPVNQRRLMLAGPGNLPVNKEVLIPTKSSQRFAAMEASLEHSRMLSFRNPERVEQRVGQLHDLLRQLMAGSLNPVGVIQGLTDPAGSAAPDQDTP